MSSVRAIIYVLGDQEKTLCDEILNKSTTQVEINREGFIVAEMATADFQYLQNNNINLETICMIPAKAELPFELPSDPAYYKVLIPLLTNEVKDQIHSMDIDLIERLSTTNIDETECDTYLFYLNPEQVNAVYTLPFVHSISQYPKHYNRDNILNIIARESSVSISCLFAPRTKPQLENFVTSWSARANKPIECFYSASLNLFGARVNSATDITYLDEMAALPNVRELGGHGRPVLH